MLKNLFCLFNDFDTLPYIQIPYIYPLLFSFQNCIYIVWVDFPTKKIVLTLHSVFHLFIFMVKCNYSRKNKAIAIGSAGIGLYVKDSV